MQKRNILIITLSILLCSCHDYKRPLPPQTKLYTKEKILLAPDQRIAMGKNMQKEWWALFSSEPLNQVIKQALRDNYDIEAAKRTLAQAEEAVKSMQGNLWPQFALDAAAGRQLYGVAFLGPLPIKIPAFSYYDLGPAVNWNVDIFGKTRYAIEQRRAIAEYQAHQLDAAYIMLTSNVVAQALEIASVKAEIAAVQRILTEDEKTFQMTQTKYSVGTGTNVAVLLAQSQLDSDRAMLPALKQRLSIAKHALAVLVGKAPADWTPPDFTFENFKLPRELPLTLPSELVRRRPDILSAEANLHAASAAVGIAIANMFPSIALSANLLQESLTPRALFDAVSTAWAMAANISAPLFTGGTLTAEKRKAKHAYESALAQYQQVVLLAFQQVADTLSALAHDAEAITIAQRTVDVATKTLSFAQQSYKAGSTGLIEVQDAQRVLAQAQLDLIRAKRQRFLDTAQLFVALGGSPVKRGKDESNCSF